MKRSVSVNQQAWITDRILCISPRYVTLLLILLISLVYLPKEVQAEEQTPATTIVNANITTDTTWTLAGSPYNVTSSITVIAGAILTIEPGVEVRFNQSTHVQVNGRIVAVGTAAQPILFTGTTAQAGWWYGLSFNGTTGNPLTGSVLDFVTVEYGGKGGYANINLFYATVDIRHSTIRHSATDGLAATAQGVANISDSTFTGNAGYPIEFGDGSVKPALSNLTVNGNGTDAIALGGGTISGEYTWRALGVPYVLDSIIVGADATLTIEAGVEVRFNQSRELVVHGKLLAVGTAAQPIRFTGTTGQAGWWYGISFSGTTAAPLLGSTLDYVTVEYGGKGAYANINLFYATVDIRHSTIRHSADDGLHGTSRGMAHISDSSFTNNAGYPINFGDGSLKPLLAAISVSGNGVDAIALGGGTISGEYTWRALGVPYVLDSIIVGTDATLTVEAGVEMRFNQSRELVVRGKVLAIGTATQPILFTATTPQAGWWYGISFSGTTSAPLTGSVLDYVTVEYGGLGAYANINLFYATLDIRHSTIRHSADDGLRGSSRGMANISDSTFTGNAGYPIELGDGSQRPLFTNLAISGNGVDAVALGGGTLTADYTWRALGVPYHLNSLNIALGATLTVEPGVVVQFKENGHLQVYGRLVAVGFVDQPILFTATTATPGWWYGISLNGNSNTAATAEFDYVTIAYGGRGSYPNIGVARAQLVMTHGLIHHSAADGISVGANSHVAIERSQIIDNGGYGIKNTSSQESNLVVAANNWWGAASGPTADDACNPGGAGSKVSADVAFKPFLSSSDQKPAPLAPTDARIITLTPRRWFSPADGVTRLYVDLTLHDGNGQPLPGRTLRLVSTSGSVVSGGVTDVQGKTVAYLTAGAAGDAELVAKLDGSACETARTPTAKVTFTAASSADLLANAEAPYFASSIQIEPEPIIRGIPTRLSAKLTNPNDFPIVVDAIFGYVQSSIGLTFGPVGDVTGKLIPAKSTGEISIVWTPSVSGHYCVELTYTYHAANVTASEAGATLQAGRSQRNLQIYPGPMGPPKEKDSLKKADNAFQFVSKTPAGKGTQIHKFIIGKWWGWMKETASEISQNLGGDPPRQDYKIFATANPIPLPPIAPEAGVSAARAAAINGVTDAMNEAYAFGVAATISLDRYGGAAAASDVQWSSLQAGALLHFKEEMAKSLLVVADRLDALRQLAISEGSATIPITADEIRAYQQRLSSSGFTVEEIADAKTVGLTDAQIEAQRQEVLATKPEEAAGDVLVYLADLATAYRTLGNDILFPPMPVFSVSGGGGGVIASATPDNLARVFNTVGTFQVGNPRATPETIQLTVRPIDLPSDWLVTTSPVSVTLAAGEQTTVTVTLIPGAAAVQGVTPRVAVEGYIGTELLGGVVMNVIVPNYAAFDGKLHLFLPVVRR